jgi:hypothetical protein
MIATFLNLGCGPNASTVTSKATQATVAAPAEPSEVELFDAKLTFEPPELIRFEVHYRFTKGRPTLNYMCNLSFPGTDNVGRKPLEAWELKETGIIKGGIELQSINPRVKDFEITMGEAEVPQSGYKTISNVLKGEVAFQEQPEYQESMFSTDNGALSFF